MDGTPTGAIGVLRSDSLLDFIEKNSFRENVVVVVVERYLAATAEFQNFDRQAIRTICRQGREAVPDITAEEICTVFVERARPLLQNRRIENLNGLVLTMWKSWLTPARIELLREEKRRLAEQQAESTAEIDQSARRMLNDPLATESEKNIARQILGDCLKPHG
jgi:molecular chaperone GrpE (heat shock protein)